MERRRSEMGTKSVNASKVLQLLLTKHADDVWASEIAVRPGGARRIDFWAMDKSHSRPCTTGYEIKVSRSDFMNDNKWMEYLPCCNRLYMVCPHGLVSKDEVMPEAGLIWVSANGSRLTTRKKAPYRTTDVNPTFVYRQLLMRLSTPLVERHFDDPLLIARIREDKRLLGDWLKEHVGKYKADKELELQRKATRLARLEPYVEVLDALGLDGYGLRARQAQLGNVSADEFIAAFKQLMNKLEPVTVDPEFLKLCEQTETLVADLKRIQKKAHDLTELFYSEASRHTWLPDLKRKRMHIAFDHYREVCARTAAGLATDEDLERYKELRDKIKAIKEEE